MSYSALRVVAPGDPELVFRVGTSDTAKTTVHVENGRVTDIVPPNSQGAHAWRTMPEPADREALIRQLQLLNRAMRAHRGQIAAGKPGAKSGETLIQWYLNNQETDPRRLAQRQKQIDIGKDSDYYRYYAENGNGTILEPDIHFAYSKRFLDGQIAEWKRRLHEFYLFIPKQCFVCEYPSRTMCAECFSVICEDCLVRD